MGKRLLLADDSITIQKVVGIIFANEDYELAIVDNGAAAVTKAREIRPDIMLVDAIMPGMSGYEVCEEARRDPALASVPILIMTGAFEPFDEDRARRSGASDFISKPFESQHLIAKVKELLQASPVAATPVAASPAPEPVQQPPAVAAPLVTPAAPVAFVTPQPELPEDDLWGAFQTEPVVEAISFAEPEVVDVFSEPVAEAFSFAEPVVEAVPFAEPVAEVVPFAETQSADVFTAEIFEGGEGDFPEAIPVNEGPAALEEEVAREFRPSWEPVEEQTFAFAEPKSPVVVPKGDDFAFGTIQAETPDMSVFAEPQPSAPSIVALQPSPQVPEPPLTPAPTVAAPVSASPAAPLSEEQLRQAVASVSRDVIERIVWEVVPDLAETMIVEAIRRIREGR